MSTTAISPEQRLFVGVIANAAQEAAGATYRAHRHGETMSEAHAWFDDAGDDFRAVCEFAGLEADDVRRRVLAYVDRVRRNPEARVRVSRINMPLRDRGTSIPDVARYAGVSPTTVSNVIHDRPNVTPATRTRVLAAVDATGYRHNVH